MKDKIIRRLAAILFLAVLATVAPGKLEAYDLKFGTNMPALDFHGFVSQGFLYSSDYNYLGDSSHGSFRFTEAGLNVSLNPLPRTRIAARAESSWLSQRLSSRAPIGVIVESRTSSRVVPRAPARSGSTSSRLRRVISSIQRCRAERRTVCRCRCGSPEGCSSLM